MEQFSNLTIDYFKNNIDNIPPKNNRTKLFDIIKPFIKNNIYILEPSAKTGEFINDLNNFDLSLNIVSNEENLILYNILKDVPNSNPINNSFLHLTSIHNFRKFDIILGSPPSLYINKKNNIGKKFKHWFVNKTDIYSIYFSRAIDLLKNNGIIAFILPDSILNSQYIQLLRNKIYNTGDILHLERMSNLFTKTTYNTVLLVFQKSNKNKNKYFFNWHDNILFTINHTLYKSLYNGSSNLKNVGANVSNGFANSNLERSSNIEYIPIIYNKNIDSNNQLQLFKNNKQYINPSLIDYKIHKQPSIIISKICGNKKDPYKFHFSICTLDKYMVHESLLLITFPGLDKEDAIISLYSIMESLNKDKTKEWVKYFIKDGLISKYQLTQYLPIYI
jgi:adenine-specific DNA-methyltransferase